MSYIPLIVIAGLIAWVIALGGFSGSKGDEQSVREGTVPETVVDITTPIDVAREAVDQIETRGSNSIDLSNQELTKVPEYIFGRTDATSLDLSHNALTGALQAEVRHLKNLRVLDLSHNTFTGVPAEVGQLGALEVLDLSYNPITGLPQDWES
jgi:Leucine-rich repeat (LRR) protein